MLKRHFITEDQANKALEQFSNEYIDKENIQYASVVKKKYHVFYNFFIEVGFLEDKDTKKVFIKENSINLNDIPSHYYFEYPSDNMVNLKKEKKEVIEIKKLKIKVKVVPSGKITFDCPKGDIMEDIGISNSGVPDGGTLGGLLYLKDHAGIFGISNWHVLKNNSGNLGDMIYHPRRKILNQAQIQEAQFGHLVWANNEDLDVGIFKIDNEEKLKILSSELKFIKRLETPKRTLKIFKYGSGTGRSSEKIRSINTTAKLWISTTAKRIYRNQIQLKRMSGPGDSGAVLYTKEGSAVGLLFASSPCDKKRGFSYANSINKIFNHRFSEPQIFHKKEGNIKIEKLIINKNQQNHE